MASDEADLSSAITEVQLALERLRIASLRTPGRASSAEPASEWEVVAPPSGELPVGSRARVDSPLKGYPKALPEPVSAPPATRAATEAAFPACPQYCLDLCVRLTSPGVSAEARARRAWRAGCWAREVLAGRWATPLSSQPLPSVRPVVYVVLYSAHLPGPARFSTFAALRAAIGEIAHSDSVLHSFGSLAEAKVYCYAAEVEFPAPVQG